MNNPTTHAHTNRSPANPSGYISALVAENRLSIADVAGALRERCAQPWPPHLLHYQHPRGLLELREVGWWCAAAVVLCVARCSLALAQPSSPPLASPLALLLLHPPPFSVNPIGSLCPSSHASVHLFPATTTVYDHPHHALDIPYTPSPGRPQVLASVMADTFMQGLPAPINPAHLTVLAGVSSILDLVTHCIASPGECLLVPAPFYPAFTNDLRVRLRGV